ncbi:MAG TPA: hypothetical protein VNB49_10600 [Candidatus Dormibacteraeota bacterium]|nr:hypothetical protein [Candidatus Dormibacteraeota bacterium]
MSEVKTRLLKWDPELRFTPSGTPLLTFDLIETSTGEVIRCLAWGDLAETVAEDDSYFGRPNSISVDVRGYWKSRRYNGKTYNEFTVQKIRHTPKAVNP